MIDIHSHFLYGLDDGAKNLKMSLAMLDQAQQLGITRLLATPHVNEHTTQPVISRIKSVFNEIKKILSDQDSVLKIELAAEINYNADLSQWLDKSWALIGPEKKYMFFELPMRGVPVDVSHTIFNLGLKKFTAVLAHPERISDILENPTQLLQWIRQGAIIQMNAGSITGQFGRKIKSFSERMLRANAVHMVASDAHDLIIRNYQVLLQAGNWISENISDEYTQILFYENPRRLLDGEEIIRFEVKEGELQRNIIGNILNLLNIR